MASAAINPPSTHRTHRRPPSIPDALPKATLVERPGRRAIERRGSGKRGPEGRRRSTPYGVNPDDTTRARLEAAARRIDRSPNWLIRQAIHRYMEQIERGELADAAEE